MDKAGFERLLFLILNSQQATPLNDHWDVNLNTEHENEGGKFAFNRKQYLRKGRKLM